MGVHKPVIISTVMNSYKKPNALLLLIFALNVYAKENIQTWEYPILGSEYIGYNCSIDTNKILMKLSFSDSGDIVDLQFLMKSKISAINDEARTTMLEEIFFGEFGDFNLSELGKFNPVIVSYTIPCQKTLHTHE